MGLTDRSLLTYVEAHCRTERGLVHRDQLRRLFRMAGEPYGFLNAPGAVEWWATTPEVIDPLVVRAREFLEMRREEAEVAYRDAWGRRKLSIGLERQRLETEMDRLQLLIADGPKDPRWQAFIDTMPGYREFWRAEAKRLVTRIERDPA